MVTWIIEQKEFHSFECIDILGKQTSCVSGPARQDKEGKKKKNKAIKQEIQNLIETKGFLNKAAH